MTRRVEMQWASISLLLCCGLVQANTDGTVFLERGHRGIVPCPLVKSHRIPPGDVVAIYWYYSSISTTSLLISYFLGRVAPQNGIPEGVYDIDNEFSLVIENVTASNEGTYYFQVKPYLKMIETGQVEVRDKDRPSPTVRVIGCYQDISQEDTCEVRVRHDSTVHNLTCVMEQVKPAFELRWLRVFEERLTELNASTTLPDYSGSSYKSNTSISASIQVPAVDDDAEYVCEAFDVAVGEGITHMVVRITESHPTTATYDEVPSSNNPEACIQANVDGTVLLERGQRGIVPCPLVQSGQIPPGEVVAIYWHYGSISRTSLLISYFNRRVAPQNGIPEGVYDIDNQFGLVIENVTASNEGTYHFEVKPHMKMLEAGKVEVCEKVSPSRPYPNVIGCDQDHNADTCEMKVRHDSTAHTLTCVMEQVKPAVQLRWLRLYLGGQTELNASTTVRPVVLPAYEGSSLRNNAYSTSASAQVAAVDDEEVYECEAVGVAVGNSTRKRVHLTKTHPTTATHDTLATHDTTATYNGIQPSKNPETTLVLTDEVSPPPLPDIPVGEYFGLIALSISFIIIVVGCVHIKRLNKKLNEYNRTLKMGPDTPVEIDSSSEEEETEFNRTSKMGPDTPVEIDSSSEEETNKLHGAPISCLSVQTDSTDVSVQTDSTDVSVQTDSTDASVQTNSTDYRCKLISPTYQYKLIPPTYQCKLIPPTMSAN